MIKTKELMFEEIYVYEEEERNSWFDEVYKDLNCGYYMESFIEGMKISKNFLEEK